MTQIECVNSNDFEREHGAAKVVHTDGTVDYIDVHAIGGDVQEMPKGYFRSLPFLGTVLVSTSASSLNLWKGLANTGPFNLPR